MVKEPKNTAKEKRIYPAKKKEQQAAKMSGIPNIYETLSLGPKNSTKLFGSCPFTNKSWALVPAI